MLRDIFFGFSHHLPAQCPPINAGFAEWRSRLNTARGIPNMVSFVSLLQQNISSVLDRFENIHFLPLTLREKIYRMFFLIFLTAPPDF